MAYLLRLIALAFALFSPGAFGACVSTSSRAYCDTRAEAEAQMVANCKPASFANKGPVAENLQANPVTYNGVEYVGYVFPQQANKTTGNLSNCSTSPDPNAGWWRAEPLIDCDSLNTSNPPGPGLYLDSQVGSKCVGGCTLDIVGDPIEVVQGRVQGQPANFYRFNREYTGEQCSGDTPPLDTEFTPTEDGPECNVSAGVCVTPEGDTEYCTFNPDGSPSSCVPAVDYDNDGQADEDDADPGTPQDGDDDGSGDETDNSASGGASCSTAPSCTGDGIACMTLYQQWKTRCAVEALRVGGAPGGSNEYQEIQAGDLGDANDYGDAGVTPDQAWRPEGEGGSGESPIFDDSGWLSSRSCPVIPVVNTSIMGTAISIDFNNEDLCWFLSLGAQLVLVFAALQSIRIYSRVI